jgi:sugar O-acyltransferase (sialic acid O-acetyltransferase NeuD family)
MNNLLIIGAVGQATNALEVAVNQQWNVIGFLDETISAETVKLGYPVYISLDRIKDPHSIYWFVAIGDNYSRERASERIALSLKYERLVSLVHPNSVVSKLSTVGKGSILMPGTIVGANTQVGDSCILGNNSVVAHDSQLGPFSSLGPSATTGGEVIVGRRSAIGLGAMVREKITIGVDSVLGANSYLNNDLKSNSIAFGNPAKLIRSREAGEPYLK